MLENRTSTAGFIIKFMDLLCCLTGLLVDAIGHREVGAGSFVYDVRAWYAGY